MHEFKKSLNKNKICNFFFSVIPSINNGNNDNVPVMGIHQRMKKF